MNWSAHLVKNFGTAFTMDNEHNYCPKTYIQLIETTKSEQNERGEKNHGKIN